MKKIMLYQWDIALEMKFKYDPSVVSFRLVQVLKKIEVNSIFILVQKHCLRLAMLASAVFALSRRVQLKFNNVVTRCVLGVP